MKFFIVYFLILFAVPAIFKSTTSNPGGYRKCYPGQHFYKIDCNTCWCLGAGIPVCTKIDCAALPKKFRSIIHPRVNRRGRMVRTGKLTHCVRIIQADTRRLNSPTGEDFPYFAVLH